MKENDQILFVVNPMAGNRDKTNLIKEVKKEANKRRLETKVYFTTGENDKVEIATLIESNSFQRVLVAGGDGTIQMVTDAILEYQIPMGILPEGSANGLAINLELPDSCEDLINVGLGDHILSMDVLEINKHICIHLADFGINAELIDNFEKGGIRGKLGYALQTLPTLIKSDQPFDFDIHTSNNSFKKKGASLVIANCKKYGTGVIINSEGKMDDGRFEIVLIKELKVWDLFKTLTDGEALDSEFAEVYSDDSATIKCKEKVPFQIDGEYIGEINEIEISLHKKKLAVAVPASFL